MSETQTIQQSKPETTTAAQAKVSVADTIVDFGILWADKGIGFGKSALENSARALDRTAKYLEEFQGRLKGPEALCKVSAKAGAAASLPGGETKKISS